MRLQRALWKRGRARAFIPDYRINLVYPKDMEEADFDRMGDNDLGFLMKVLKLGNKNFGTMFSEERYKTVNPESAILANEIANLGLKIEVTEKGDVDMCQAMVEQNRAIRIKTTAENLLHIMIAMGWDQDKAMATMGVAEDDRKDVGDKVREMMADTPEGKPA